MSKQLTIKQYYTSTTSQPSPNSLEHGEIVLGIADNAEAIYFKNASNEIVSIKPSFDVLSLVTYAELQELKTNSQLTVGSWYRITDFVTTVANDNEARSANHPFDIIVLATDVNVLQEECYAAMPSNGDNYFQNCQLDAWKVWYCLDNDTTRFQWADTANGKGIIYHLIDEWNNDCPYDFKNIQFKRYKVVSSLKDVLSDFIDTFKEDGAPMYFGINHNEEVFKIDNSDFKWKYTFNTLEETDASINVARTIPLVYKNAPSYPYNNVIKPNIATISEDGEIKTNVISLNNIVFLDYYEDNDIQEDFAFVVYGNTFNSNCHSMTLGRKCYDNTFGVNCYYNSFGNGCNGNQFGDNNYNNTFGNNNYSNSFGDGCSDNQFGNGFFHNILGNGCCRNQFGNDCSDNQFGNNLSYDTFGNDFQYNTLGDDVQFINVLDEKVYYTNILNGTKGEALHKLLDITFETEKDYCQFAGFDSDGQLQVWVDADLGKGDVIYITYAELKSLKDNSKLNLGKYYRITDFVTTVANDDEARSANHPFDIIVMATDTNVLQEEAFAALPSNGDDYFKDSQLNAWKIWYCLENDTKRFQWADDENGKGVIYRMIDEWQNDCPYDFKNVQFKRYKVLDNSNNGELVSLNGKYYGYNGQLNKLTINNKNDFKWAYTFTLIDEDNEWIDYSLKMTNGVEEDLSYFTQTKKGRCAYNLIRYFYSAVSFEDVYYQVQSLNNIVLISATDPSGVPNEMLLNTFGVGNYNMTLKRGPEQNHFGDECYNNIIDSYNNTFGHFCQYNTFGDDCHSNTFGNDIYGNSCEGAFYRNTLGNHCNGNSFGESCWHNTFGSDCEFNMFGNRCQNNSFGVHCCYSKFGNDFQCNTLGNGVQYINVLEQKVYHTNILNGTKGTSSSNLLEIPFKPNVNYCQFAGFDSTQTLRVWAEGDLADGKIRCGTF